MGISDLLGISQNFIDFAVDTIPMVKLNFIAKIIQMLINGVGVVGVGIILFTLILKTLVLPLDIYSRYKSKKQSLLMKAMRPQMEKLQKQYENDKQMYNQKVMQLQKENGISMFGACLPMIISLVIFMVVFSAFSTYSQYANLKSYNDMVGKYNASVYQYVYNDENTEGFLLGRYDSNLDGYIEITVDGATEKVNTYLIDFDAFKEVVPQDESFDTLNESEKMSIVRNFVREGARKAAADYYREVKSNVYKKDAANKQLSNKFLWVRNIWYPDSLLNKEVPNFSKFSSAIARAAGSVATGYSESYDEVTYYLRNPGYSSGKLEGNAFNGYFVLIVSAIGLMFLQQFITMRSQKDANELSTVDGSGSRTNKWMLVLMPIMYGAFSFFYSAAFSIYMITNTTYSLITTVIINKVMDVSFAKKEASGELFKKKEKKSKKNKTTNRKRLKNGRR